MKFGIVIATYQRADGKTPFYLDRLLKSIYNQTYKDFKVYIIGDKYENSGEFIELITKYKFDNIYCENLPQAVEREKYKSNPLRLWCCGGVNATNYGIEMAVREKYNYVCCPDHDDYWTENHLEIINKVLMITGAPWVCTRAIYGSGLLPDTPVGVLGIEEFVPKTASVIKSSVCMDFRRVPLKYRDFYEAEGVDKPSDADLWDRCGQFLLGTNMKGYLIDTVSCMHHEEGYVLRGGENGI